jgi:hypothetical protein
MQTESKTISFKGQNIYVGIEANAFKLFIPI